MLCIVYRFEPKSEGERKQFFPLTFCQNAAAKREWRWQGLPDPRPLYNLDKLARECGCASDCCRGRKKRRCCRLTFP
ncbi:MAG: hypothetical protein WDM70_02030 [Nitrosomonadales bacterium]